MKRVLVLIIIILLSITIIGCNNKKSDALKFKEEYESQNEKKLESGKVNRSVSISKENPFIYTTAEEIIEKMNNKETFIVYFGFSTCPWCRSIIEELINCANDYDVDKIYYVDISNIRDEKEYTEDGIIETTKEGTKGYKELLSKMDNVLKEYTLENDNNSLYPFEIGRAHV